MGKETRHKEIIYLIQNNRIFIPDSKNQLNKEIHVYFYGGRNAGRTYYRNLIKQFMPKKT